jgi:Uma2 family endonuclease
MRRAQRSAAAAGVVEEEYYPDTDGQPVAETEIHLLLMLNTLACLRHLFRRRRDIYVAGNMFLYYRKGAPEKRCAPDIMVVKGVDGRIKRRSFKTWEEKAVPRTVIEFTSEKTAAEDLDSKKNLYRLLKVNEFFLFDPLHDYLPQPLLGFGLVDGAYQVMQPAADGSLVSDELGLRLCPEGNHLGLYDVKTGARLLPIDDALRLLEEMQTRVAELEAEVERLRKARKKRRHNG